MTTIKLSIIFAILIEMSLSIQVAFLIVKRREKRLRFYSFLPLLAVLLLIIPAFMITYEFYRQVYLLSIIMLLGNIHVFWLGVIFWKKHSPKIAVLVVALAVSITVVLLFLPQNVYIHRKYQFVSMPTYRIERELKGKYLYPTYIPTFLNIGENWYNSEGEKGTADWLLTEILDDVGNTFSFLTETKRRADSLRDYYISSYNVTARFPNTDFNVDYYMRISSNIDYNDLFDIVHRVLSCETTDGPVFIETYYSNYYKLESQSFNYRGIPIEMVNSIVYNDQNIPTNKLLTVFPYKNTHYLIWIEFKAEDESNRPFLEQHSDEIYRINYGEVIKIIDSMLDTGPVL